MKEREREFSNFINIEDNQEWLKDGSLKDSGLRGQCIGWRGSQRLGLAGSEQSGSFEASREGERKSGERKECQEEAGVAQCPTPF